MPIIGACEPDSGSRYSAVKAKLAEAFHDPGLVRMAERHSYDSVGMQLTDQFMSHLEVLCAWASLPYHQKRAIELWIGPTRMNQVQIGRVLGCSDRTVRDYIRDGLETMIRQVYDKLP